MAKILQTAQAIIQGNTGMSAKKSFNPALIVGALALPKGTVLTAAQLAVIQTTLQAGLIHDTYTSRYHRFGIFDNYEAQGEDRTQQTTMRGNKITTRDASYYFRFQYTINGMEQHLSYLKFKGRENEFEFLFYDKKGVLFGTRGVDATGNLSGLKGIGVYEIYTENWMPATDSEVAAYYIGFGISDAKDINENLAFVELDFDLFELNAVQDVELVPLTAVNSTGGFNLDVLAGAGNANLVELFGSAIADTALFVIKNKETGGTITFSTVSIGGVTPNRYLICDVDSADADYPDQGDEFTVALTTVSGLTAEGISYYESNVTSLVSTTP